MARPAERHLSGSVFGPFTAPGRRRYRQDAGWRRHAVHAHRQRRAGVWLQGYRCCSPRGVNKGRLRLPEFVALASTNAARLYGIYPRKGTIAVGADADLAIWNPGREVIIRHELLHDNVDYTPYEGMLVKGWPEITISRGDVVWRDGRLLGTPGRGTFCPWANLRTLVIRSRMP